MGIVKEEKKNGDRIAEIIHKLNLESNHISLLLSNIPYDSSEEELTGKPEVVEVDISLSAFANVKRYFDMKKNAKEKKLKTEASDNYIVISGRDAQQNELIVKRYMQKGDLYVHADIHGASSCVIKNPSGNVVPPSTLEQAGQMAICRSAAWNAKVVTSAYWVYSHQVSKTAPTGEYLTTGSFMIRGKKNFLPPAMLAMGFGVLFRLDESCVSRHAGERGGKLDSSAVPSILDDDDNSEFKKLGEQVNDKKADKETSTTAETPEKGNNEETEEPVENVNVNEDNGDNESEESEEESEENENENENEGDEEVAEKPGNEAEEFQPAHLGIPEKYRIDFSMVDEEDEDEEDPSNPKGSRPRISKKQRKLMKKGIDPATVQADSGPGGKKKQNQQKSKQAAAPEQTQMSRRQRSKMKKMKTKYKDQDEEERALRMKILASAGKPEESDPKEDNEDEEEEVDSTTERKELTEAEQKELEEYRTKMKEEREETLQALTSEQMSNVSLLDELTGKPLEDDVLSCAIPMCGPYAAVKDFKFKVKLVPGNLKTGKAVQTSLNVLKNTNGITPQEKDLITSMNDSECMLQMMGGVTVATPGFSNLSKKNKIKKGKPKAKNKRNAK